MFYPDPAYVCSLRAGGPIHFLAPGKGASPLSTPSRPTLHAPRPMMSGPAVSSRPQTFPHWLLPSTDNRIGKDRTGPHLDERSPYFSMAPNRAIPAEKSIRSSPLAAAQPLTMLSRRQATQRAEAAIHFPRPYRSAARRMPAAGRAVSGVSGLWAGSLQGLLPGAPTDPGVHVKCTRFITLWNRCPPHDWVVSR